MSVKEIYSELLDEKYYSINHKSGLKILVYPKEEYSSCYAIFGTKYGSIDTRFRLEGENQITEVPEGIAHFLEHKLFESEELDAFERYAKTGASANAYTSFDRTCYLFSCSANFIPSLEILLDFVQSPYFTKETVEKEQGIIGQEIRMYDDVPDWKVLFNMLKGMYHNHPVKIDIAGTQESIAEITDKLLYKCYNTFYNLHNMVLCIAGNVTLNEVLEAADRLIKPAKDQKVIREFADEPDSVVTSEIEEKMSVASPVFCFGYKETVEAEEVSLKKRIETEILLDMLIGDSSELFQELLSEGLVNMSFSSEYFTGGGYASIIFSGESSDPRAIKARLEEKIKDIRRNGIDKNCFERSRKLLYGRSIMSYNNVETISNALVSAHFLGNELFDELNIYRSLTSEDIRRRLDDAFDENRSVLSVILPE